MSGDARWPPLPVADWQGTRDTLQLWTQVVGKVRMEREAPLNHWWNVPLYVTVRGLTTSLIPHPSGVGFQIDFDLDVGRLELRTTAGGQRVMDLGPGPVAEFYAAVTDLLGQLGVATPIWPMPVEIEGAIPFPDDRVHTTYVPVQARDFWLALVQIERVFQRL